ncbi:hypothetical protein EXV95_09255 [Acidovorax sp. JMULE5]|uniref:hypothetical protein n=1 Tax=Acidovorax sp. JMULE5 TaxID=2518343 RepID=UPI0015A16AA5|nr:hypothetical protein [Acidovorax sp. JMULE5]QLA80797.1 hypothetical protein EXV95_09255 [Acidovorax sp. JMULE5]
MTANALHPGSAASDVSRHHGERRPGAIASPQGSTGLGGNTLAQIVEDNCPGTQASAGVVIEHLDAQAGTWQFSMDEGQTWRAIRTDLINRDGNLGLALDCDARLRVLPFGGHRVSGVRVAFHTVQRRHGQGNGSYRAYASDEREEGCSRTVTLVLGLSAINGAPPAVHVPRPRNKRALVQRAAAAAGAAGTTLSGSMVLA